MSATTWAIYFAIMPLGQTPILDLMESNLVPNIASCIQQASIKWNDYYQWNPPRTNNFTYCVEMSYKPKYMRVIDVKCTRDGICSTKGIKNE